MIIIIINNLIRFLLKTDDNYYIIISETYTTFGACDRAIHILLYAICFDIDF